MGNDITDSNFTTLIDAPIIPTLPEDLWYQRPIKIDSSYNGVGTDFVKIADVPTKWLADNLVLARIKNVHLIRPTFRVRVRISPIPTIYGKFVVALGMNMDFNYATNFVTADNIFDLPHWNMAPSTVNMIEFDVPFVYPISYWSLNNTSTGIDVSDLNISGSANTPHPFVIIFRAKDMGSTQAVFPGLTVNIEAWCTKLEMAQPYASQSGKHKKDEYQKPAISKMATSVASISSKFEGYPVIGTAARATTLAASAIGSIASLFGYSRPLLIEDPTLVIQQKYGNSCSLTAGRFAVKLAGDIKQEVPLNPEQFGGTSQDELTFDNLMDHWSLVADAVADTGSGSFGTLVAIPVTPCMARLTPTAVTYHMSKAEMCAHMFNFWRGDMIYKVRVHSTVYHSGQLILMWNPNPGAAVNLDTNRNEHVLIDVSGTKEIIFTVKYGSNVPFCKTRTFVRGDGRITVSADSYFNGELILAIYTPISGVATADINIQVFQKGGPGFLFHTPSDFSEKVRFDDSSVPIPVAAVVPLGSLVCTDLVDPSLVRSSNISGYVPQSGTTSDSLCGGYASDAIFVEVGSHSNDAFEMENTQGQTFKSLRPYLKRNMPHMRLILTGTIFGTAVDLTGNVQIPKTRSLAGGVPQTYYVESNMLNVITPLFVGHRGALRYHAVTANSANDSGVIITDRWPDNPTFTAIQTLRLNTFPSSLIYNRAMTSQYTPKHNSQLFDSDVEEVSFELPYGSRAYYHTTNQMRGTVFTIGHQSDVKIATLFNTPHANVVTVDISAGEDFNVFYPTITPPFTVAQGTIRNQQIAPSSFAEPALV